MKRAAAIAAVLGGLLLVLVPRYILPVCEFQGYQPMHCSDTARAEVYAGLALAASGIAVLLVERPVPGLMALTASLCSSIAAMLLPGIFGFCRSPKMPCNYGTVPAIRLIALATAVLALFAMLSGIKQLLRKDRP